MIEPIEVLDHTTTPIAFETNQQPSPFAYHIPDDPLVFIQTSRNYVALYLRDL